MPLQSESQCANRVSETASEISSWRRRCAPVVSVASAAVAIPALAGFAAPWGWPFELACHFRTQYFWGLLVSGALLMLLCRKKAASAILLLWVVHAGLLWRFYLPFDESRPFRRELRVLSLNLYSGNQQSAAVLDLVRTESPDVAIFYEVSEQWGERLQSLDNEWTYTRIEPRPGNLGIALFSRHPLVDSRIEFLSNNCPAVVARMDIDGREVTIIGAHPYPPVSGPATESRNRQLEALAELVRSCAGGVVVVGDLNTTSWSPAFGALVGATGLQDSRIGFGIQPSWPSSWPRLLQIPIDHCLISAGMEVLARRIGPDVGSDHLPVIVDLASGKGG